MSMLADIRCPLVLAVPNHGQKHRLDCDRRAERIIPCYLVGYHKFKPKSQYNSKIKVVYDTFSILSPYKYEKWRFAVISLLIPIAA